MLALINVWFIRALLTSRHDDHSCEVLEVEPDDAYLRHVLRVHRVDVLKHQPDFEWNGAAPGNRAYLVQRGDETVGVVLLHDAGDGVAQIVLDCVTPRFQDFSPDEFVWRKSGLLTSSGFTRVVTPANMRSPYYDQIGFRRFEGAFTLDL